MPLDTFSMQRAHNKYQQVIHDDDDDGGGSGGGGSVEASPTTTKTTTTTAPTEREVTLSTVIFAPSLGPP